MKWKKNWNNTKLGNSSCPISKKLKINLLKEILYINKIKILFFIRNNMEQMIYARTSTGEEDKTTINSYAGRNI